MTASRMPAAEALDRKRQLGLTWIAFAARCGVSPRTLRRQLQSGYLSPPLAELLRSQQTTPRPPPRTSKRTYAQGTMVVEGVLYIGETIYGPTCVELDTGELFAVIGQRIVVPRPPGEEGGEASMQRWQRWSAACREQVKLGDIPRQATDG